MNLSVVIVVILGRKYALRIVLANIDDVVMKAVIHKGTHLLECFACYALPVLEDGVSSPDVGCLSDIFG